MPAIKAICEAAFRMRKAKDNDAELFKLQVDMNSNPDRDVRASLYMVSQVPEPTRYTPHRCIEIVLEMCLKGAEEQEKAKGNTHE